MYSFCLSIIKFKTIIAFWMYVLFAPLHTSAQGKYKRTYTLKDNYFTHVASYSSGNAIMYIDRDSLLENLYEIANYSEYYETTKQKVKVIIDTINILAQQSDITSISSLTNDPEVRGIALAYFSKCLLNKQANVYDKRSKEFVKKIVVKKSQHSSRSFSTYSWYYYFLPDDKKEFMHRVEKSGTGIKFL